MISHKSNPVLVLGHTGFLGKAVVKELESRNIDYQGVSRSSGIDLRIPKQLINFVGDMKFSTIVNCAAHVGGINYGLKNQKAIFEDNLKMNLSLMDAWIYCKSRLINPISNCAYPSQLNRFSEDQFWDGPVHDSVYAYGHTRRTLVASSKIYSQEYNLEVSNVIFPNIYGPGESENPEKAHALGGLISRMIVAIKNDDKNFVVWGSGTPIREWLFIDDAAHILVEASQSKKVFPLRNFGVGKGVSIAELTRLIAKELKYEGNILFDATKPDGATEKVMVVNQNLPSLATKELESFTTGLRKTISWYLQK